MITRSLPSDRSTPLSYVALGDSTVYGLGASSPARHYVARLFQRVREEYPAARLLNRGVCMATAADVLAQQVPEAVLERPHLVTLSVGPNDLRRGVGPQDFARRVEVILERLHRETEATVVVNQLPDMAFCPRFSPAERSLVSALTRHYNHALQHVADGFGMELVDIGIADRPEHERRRFFSDDGYHPSDEGYAAWADAVWAAVRTLIPPPPLHWPRLVANIA
ncbi:MAG TPA: SGNH/GDSL hydrolase family protein [Candidatus Dormibacteraeota bacterium]|nr:SGNH/GDSL hydrolase family protein [Candidatus Dormibacteraeota bacterium]